MGRSYWCDRCREQQDSIEDLAEVILQINEIGDVDGAFKLEALPNFRFEMDLCRSCLTEFRDKAEEWTKEDPE